MKSVFVPGEMTGRIGSSVKEGVLNSWLFLAFSRKMLGCQY